jgi:hypothetical protein
VCVRGSPERLLHRVRHTRVRHITTAEEQLTRAGVTYGGHAHEVRGLMSDRERALGPFLGRPSSETRSMWSGPSKIRAGRIPLGRSGSQAGSDGSRSALLCARQIVKIAPIVPALLIAPFDPRIVFPLSRPLHHHPSLVCPRLSPRRLLRGVIPRRPARLLLLRRVGVCRWCRGGEGGGGGGGGSRATGPRS